MSRPFKVSLLIVALVGFAVLGFVARHRFESTEPQADAGPVGQPAAGDSVDLGGQKFRRWAKARELPDLHFSDPAGKPTSLKHLRGRVILLNLWATWCPPCLEEMPALDRLHARLGGEKFAVVTLALDSPAKAEAFLRQIKATTLQAYTDTEGRALRTLGVSAVPTTLLIDPRGREIGRLSGAAAWDQQPAVDLILSYLKELPR